MLNENTFINWNYSNLPRNNFVQKNNNTNVFNKTSKFIIIIFSFCAIILFVYNNDIYKISFFQSKEKIYFDKFDVYKYNEIKDKLNISICSEMWGNQREFLNGIIRKFKPRKILEIGVRHGGSSIVILNAIDDLKNSHLYSIDLSPEEDIGECVIKYFPKFMKKWSLFKGNIATEYIENIGGKIDLVFIDTAHFEPGEILDFLIVLPFLKEEAIVIFHDIANQITRSTSRNEWAPYIIFNGIRGEKYLPSGKGILTQDIGAVRLDRNQNKFYHDYFRLLGGQWQYFPKEEHIIQLRKHFKNYYDDKCLIMFEEALSFNRNFVKQNPKIIIYKYNSD